MYQAIGKHIVAKEIKEEQKTVILTTREPMPIQYEIVSVGENVTSLKVGDILPAPQYVMHHLANNLCILNCETVYAKKL